MLLIGAKILLNTDSNEEATIKIHDLQNAEVDFNDALQRSFIFETLIQFDQILRTTSIDIWHYKKEKIKQASAANIISAKMEALQTITATSATAAAIAKATEAFNGTQEDNTHTKLRVSNLEKSFLKQEQKTNELINILKKNKAQKNSNRGYREPVASAAELALLPQKHQKMVDLTRDEEEEDVTPTNHSKRKTSLTRPKTNLKKKRTTITADSNVKNSIKWKTSETLLYNPNEPALNSSVAQLQPPAVSVQSHSPSTPPLFPPAPAPVPLWYRPLRNSAPGNCNPEPPHSYRRHN